MKDMIDWLITPPAGSPGGEQPGVDNRFAPANGVEQPAISILVCDLEGLDGGEISRRLVQDLAGEDRVRVQPLAKRLKAGGTGTLAERMVSAAETGRKWLISENADILLWGEVSADNRAVTIRFLCVQADADTQPGSIGLGDSLELPVQYTEEMGAVIYGTVLAAVGPRKPSPQRDELALLLEQPVLKLDSYIDTPPNELRQMQFASVMAAVGNIHASQWRLTKNPKSLDTAIHAYQMALENSYDPEHPLHWALTQNHLAASLQAQSIRDNDPAPLLAAVNCYHSVASALGAHSHANDWALAQIHLGDVLVKLAKFERPVQHLKSASEAYQKALKIFPRQTMPGPWSELMNQLGVALMNMGEAVSGERIYEQSAACFRQSLEVRRRDIAPLLWAQTVNNLGAVTFSLYRRNEKVEILEEAAACFKGASEVYLEFGDRNKAMVAHRNMEKVLNIQKNEA